MKPCPSCRWDADRCPYRGEAKPGCLRDKRIRDDMNERLQGITAKELLDRIKQRAKESP